MKLSTSRRGAGWIGLAMVGLLAGCQAAPSDSANRDLNQPQPDDAKPAVMPAESGAAPKVIATFSVLGDIVRQVAGTRASVRTLVGPGGDAHTFEPSPGDAAAVGEATIIFENGLGLEGWMGKLYASSASKATRIVLTKGLPIRQEAGGEPDPHVWHDVANVITMTLAVGVAMSEADPAGTEAYQMNALNYVRQLQMLDREIVGTVAGLPPERRKLVTSHDTFGYFAARYGFEVVGTALASASTEAAEPSAAQMAGLVGEIKAAGVPTIFADNVSNPELIRRIAEAAGVGVGEPLFTDALGEAGSEGESYVAMMRHNIRAIAAGLGATE